MEQFESRDSIDRRRSRATGVRTATWLALAALLLATPSVVAAQEKKPSRGDAELHILAASSLTEVIRTLEARWERERGTPLTVSFGGSSRLATQIASGARADVYLSADRRWVEKLAERDQIDPSTRTPFASNRLVWIVPEGTQNPPRSLVEVRGDGPERLALGGPNVPAGSYARRSLREAGLWEGLKGRAISAENVKRALQWVALGEADAGIVYETDARASADVRIAFPLPDRLQPTIRYEGAVPRSAAHPDLGRDFLQFLTGPTAREVLANAGFTTDLSGTDTSTPSDRAASGGVDERSAIVLSLLVGLGCVIGGLFPALLLGWLLARRSFRGKSLVATFLLAPLALPPVVTGFLLLRVFGTSGLLGPVLSPLGLRVPFTTLGAGLAAFVVSFPLYLLTARSAFEIVDRRYEDVSMTLGYRPRTTFWRVTIPLALPGIAAGGLLTFARAIGEFGATAVLAGNVRGETQTIPLAIYTLLESPSGYDAIWLLVGVSLVLALTAVLGFEWFNRRQRRHAGGR